MAVRLDRILPYAIVLAIVSYLYFLTGKIDFVAPGGRIGPNFWPKVILALTALTCLYEIGKNLFFARREGGRDLEGVLGSVLKEVPVAAAEAKAEPEEKSYPHLLWAGIGLTVLYVVVIPTLGFLAPPSV